MIDWSNFVDVVEGTAGLLGKFRGRYWLTVLHNINDKSISIMAEDFHRNVDDPFHSQTFSLDVQPIITALGTRRPSLFISELEKQINNGIDRFELCLGEYEHSLA